MLPQKKNNVKIKSNSTKRKQWENKPGGWWSCGACAIQSARVKTNNYFDTRNAVEVRRRRRRRGKKIIKTTNVATHFPANVANQNALSAEQTKKSIDTFNKIIFSIDLSCVWQAPVFRSNPPPSACTLSLAKKKQLDITRGTEQPNSSAKTIFLHIEINVKLSGCLSPFLHTWCWLNTIQCWVFEYVLRIGWERLSVYKYVVRVFCFSYAIRSRSNNMSRVGAWPRICFTHPIQQSEVGRRQTGMPKTYIIVEKGSKAW